MNAVKVHFDKVSAGYRSLSGRGLWRILRRREARTVAALLPAITDSTTALDLGSGSGFYSDLLRQENVRDLTCVDFSEKMLAKIENPDYLKIRADIEEYRSNKNYDIILCAGALEFSKEPLKVFVNVASMLKNGGSFILLYPTKNFLGRLYQLYHRQHGFSVTLYEDRKLLSFSTQAGLRLISHSYLFPFTGVVKYTCEK